MCWTKRVALRDEITAGVDRRRTWSSLRRMTWAALLCCVTMVGQAEARGEDPGEHPGEAAGDRARIARHLEAGEFGPALRIVHGIRDEARRDALLQEVARAQSALGARRASIATAASIRDDRVRQSAFDRIAGGGERGGAAQADFDTLIELITSTISPPTWDEVGGPGAIDGFPGGVYVDGGGLLSKLPAHDGGASLAKLRRESSVVDPSGDAHRPSSLRKVSLRRLERRLQRLAASGESPDEAMRCLAGIHKVKYLFVYPESGDIVLAGPAGPWRVNQEGRFVNADTSAPVLSLDDFVVVLRNAYRPEPRFGCSITPSQDNLARARAFQQESAKRSSGPRDVDRWLTGLRESLGRQEIDVFGIDAGTRAAKVLVEADYRMKLVGMGLEEGVLGVESYLDSLEVSADQPLPDMNVLRWWFTLNYDSVLATEGRDAFEIRGQGVKVLSENELLTEQGKRVHTGKSDEQTGEFARDFTRHFPRLAAKYPIYAELRNVFDLALVAALIRHEDLPGQVGWHMTYFDPRDQNRALRHRPARGNPPKQVDTIANHRVVRSGNKKIFVAGVSGGVSFDARPVVARDRIETDDYGLLRAQRSGSRPDSDDRWWWD